MGTHDWPGNVRELVNVVSVAATLADTPEAIDDVLTLAREPAPPPLAKIGEAPSSAQAGFADAKRQVRSARSNASTSRRLVRRAKGNVSEMARQERHGAPPRARLLAQIRNRQRLYWHVTVIVCVGAPHVAVVMPPQLTVVVMHGRTL